MTDNSFDEINAAFPEGANAVNHGTITGGVLTVETLAETVEAASKLAPNLADFPVAVRMINPFDPTAQHELHILGVAITSPTEGGDPDEFTIIVKFPDDFLSGE